MTQLDLATKYNIKHNLNKGTELNTFKTDKVITKLNTTRIYLHLKHLKTKDVDILEELVLIGDCEQLLDGMFIGGLQAKINKITLEGAKKLLKLLGDKNAAIAKKRKKQLLKLFKKQVDLLKRSA